MSLEREIRLAHGWLFARFQERFFEPKIVRTYYAPGVNPADVKSPSVIAQVLLEEFHEYVSAISDNLPAVVRHCKDSGWIKLAEQHGPDGVLRYYMVFPAVNSVGLSAEDRRNELRGVDPEKLKLAGAALTATQFDILKELSKSPNMALLPIDLESAGCATRKTLTPVLNQLKTLGLICQPNGSRKGWAITVGGKRLLRSCPAH